MILQINDDIKSSLLFFIIFITIFAQFLHKSIKLQAINAILVRLNLNKWGIVTSHPFVHVHYHVLNLPIEHIDIVTETKLYNYYIIT